MRCNLVVNGKLSIRPAASVVALCIGFGSPAAFAQQTTPPEGGATSVSQQVPQETSPEQVDQQSSAAEDGKVVRDASREAGIGVPMSTQTMESGGDLGSPSLDFQGDEESVLVSPDAASYQFYITDLESRLGPYAPGLSEQLLGLGSVHQRQGLHAEAIEVFKRGVHIARINEGLDGSSQIPLLQREIQSLMALGDFEAADERQYYLYRVQAKAYGNTSAAMTAAMLERAEWEREAYYMSLGNASFLRLLTMWELYGKVLRNISRSSGSLSADLLLPLKGLLQTQYMISTYTTGTYTGLNAGAAADTNFAEENQFSIIRASNYKKGQSVLTAMREVYGYNEPEQSQKPIEALVRLGDWHLWHGKRDSAQAAYARAWDELAALDNGEQLQQQFFGKPTLLPDLPGARTELQTPKVIRGYVDLSFAINTRGRVTDLEIVAEENVQEFDDEAERSRLRMLRRLKRMRYRPQLEDGTIVSTEEVTKRYAY